MKDLGRKIKEYQEIVRRTQAGIYFLKKKEKTYTIGDLYEGCSWFN